MSTQQRFTALFMAAVFHLEFVPDADIYKTANYLRTLGISATVPDDLRDKIIIDTDSYNKTLEELSEIVPKLPDIYRFTWNDGSAETLLYEAPLTRQFIPDTELLQSLKVVPTSKDHAGITIVLREDKNTIIKYHNIVRKVEKMGFKVTFADGFLDAGWLQLPAIIIEIPNNVSSFKEAVWQLSEIPEVNRFLYNYRKSPHQNEHTVIFEKGTNLEEQVSKFFANGLEVYKIDKVLNKLFIHFPQDEAQNKNKIEEIKNYEGVVAIKNIHQNKTQFSLPEFSENMKTVWLDVPVDVVSGERSNADYIQQLNWLAKKEVERLQAKGMIVLHYGLYAETGEILLPEVVFTYKNADSPKAEGILNQYKDERSDIILPSSSRNMCVQLFN